MKIGVFSLGCKVNQYEGGALISLLKEKGWDAFDGLQKADVYVLNTCAVTSQAEKKSRQAISRINAINANCKILVCGCASEKNCHQFEGLPNVTFVKGVANKKELLEKIDEIGTKIDELPLVYEDLASKGMKKTRFTLKVQDGCNNFCSYCIVPFLRGRSRSRKLEDILAEIEQNKDLCNEFVLTGIDLSSYGKDIGSSLSQLVKELSNVKGVRFRFGSLEVGVVDEIFIQEVEKASNFCHQFHLSLQSGSDEVLRKMNRHYTAEQYFQSVCLIRKHFENASITTDIIVGFPTESEISHKETLSFVRKVGFYDIHVFPYSKRGGTIAAGLEQVEKSVVSRRVRELTQEKEKLKQKFLESQIGKIEKVCLEESESRFHVCHTSNFTKVFVDGGNQGDLIEVRLAKIFRDGILCERI